MVWPPIIVSTSHVVLPAASGPVDQPREMLPSLPTATWYHFMSAAEYVRYIVNFIARLSPLFLVPVRSPRRKNLSRSTFHFIVPFHLRMLPVAGSMSSPLQDQVPFIFFATAASSAGGSGWVIGSAALSAILPLPSLPHGSPAHGSFLGGAFFLAAQGFP